MRLETFFLLVTVATITTVFVVCAVQMVADYENRSKLTWGQKGLLFGIVLTFVGVGGWMNTECFWENNCSLALLLVVAIIDAQTGFVYNCFGYAGLISSGLLAAQNHLKFSGYEIQLLCVFLMFVIISVVLKGLGEGDMPVYFSLMFYYICYFKRPAEMTMLMFFVSQAAFGVGALLCRKKRLPLVPYIWVAHLITTCVDVWT